MPPLGQTQMGILQELLLSDAPLTAAQRRACRQALESDPSLLLDVQRWLQMQVRLGDDLHAALPERRTVVLYILAKAGYADTLSMDELLAIDAYQDMMSDLRDASPVLCDIEARIEEDCNVFEECWEQPVRVLKLVPQVWRIAAAIVVLVAAGLVGNLVTRSDIQTIAVSGGEAQEVVLPDGSTVHLVAEAELSYTSKDFGREVILTGSALFDVVPGDLAFRISAEEAVVTVLGTRFGVRAINGRTTVILERGQVELAGEHASGQPVTLAPGQMSSVAAGGSPSAPEQVDLMHALGWTGFLFFDATPMEEVARVLGQRYGVEVALDKSLQEEEVSGAFGPTDTAEYILTSLAAALDASLEGSKSSGFRLHQRAPESSL